MSEKFLPRPAAGQAAVGPKADPPVVHQASARPTLPSPRPVLAEILRWLKPSPIKIGAKMDRPGRQVMIQTAEVAVSRRMFGQILARIVRLRAPPVPA